jgi:transposase
VLGDYQAAVVALEQRRSASERAIEELWPESPWAETIARLRCLRGISTLTALGLCAEAGDLRRFDRPPALVAYFGIVPSEHSSGPQRRRGPITRAGSAHARRLLVEASHHYRHQPAVGGALERRQRGADPRACEIGWRAQRRLHHQWQRLRELRAKRPARPWRCRGDTRSSETGTSPLCGLRCVLGQLAGDPPAAPASRLQATRRIGGHEVASPRI